MSVLPADSRGVTIKLLVVWLQILVEIVGFVVSMWRWGISLPSLTQRYPQRNRAAECEAMAIDDGIVKDNMYIHESTAKVRNYSRPVTTTEGTQHLSSDK
jgi:hypothetical protein